jgi:hypothetical protein
MERVIHGGSSNSFNLKKKILEIHFSNDPKEAFF